MVLKKMKSIVVFSLIVFLNLLPTGFVQAAPEMGIYTPNVTELSNIEGKIGKNFSNFLWYQRLSDSFDSSLGSYAKSRNIALQISLEFGSAVGGANQPAYKLSNISRGDFDTDIIRWATQLRDYGDTIYLRPMPEMNGYWIPWGGLVNGNKPGDFVPAWRHVHDIFVAQGATNVKFVWAVNFGSSPRSMLNDITQYYPGDAYVDYIGINGYNFGPYFGTWFKWEEFAKVFTDAYIQMSSNNYFPTNQATVETNTTGFYPFGSGSVILRNTTQNWEGSASLQTNTNWTPYKGFKTSITNARSGYDYTFSVYLKGSGTVYLELTDGTKLRQSQWITLNSNWTKYSLTIHNDRPVIQARVLTPYAHYANIFADAMQMEESTMPKIFTTDNNKPIMICETSTPEYGGSKASWITNMFSYIKYMPRLSHIFWFDVNKEADWRIDSTTSSLNAFIAGWNSISPN